MRDTRYYRLYLDDNVNFCFRRFLMSHGELAMIDTNKYIKLKNTCLLIINYYNIIGLRK